MQKNSGWDPPATFLLKVAEDAHDKARHNLNDVQSLQKRRQRDLQLHHPVPDCDVDEPQSQEGKPPLLRGVQD